jgi:heme/copper-type cytochrome/quinol oxidase subunit 2
MKSINKKSIIIAIVVVVVVVVIVIILAFVMMGGKKGNAPGSTSGNSGSPSATSSSAPASSTTLLPLPANVVVPEAGATNTGSVAVPQVEAPAAPGVVAKYRSFNITVQNGQFSPSTIAVNVGDTVDLEIKAVGGTYDFTQPDLGFNAALPDGVTKKIQFAPSTAGKFVFYCSSCGGPTKGPVGYIVVAGK